MNWNPSLCRFDPDLIDAGYCLAFEFSSLNWNNSLWISISIEMEGCLQNANEVDCEDLECVMPIYAEQVSSGIYFVSYHFNWNEYNMRRL